MDTSCSDITSKEMILLWDSEGDFGATEDAPGGEALASTGQSSTEDDSGDAESFVPSVVDYPDPKDILCGCSSKCLSHPGSLYFKSVINACADPYKKALTRGDKMAVTRRIMHVLLAEGHRFLKLNRQTKKWETLHPVRIIDKIGHAIRFAINKPEKQGTSTPPRRRSRSPPDPLRDAVKDARANASSSRTMPMPSPASFPTSSVPSADMSRTTKCEDSTAAPVFTQTTADYESEGLSNLMNSVLLE